MMPDLLHNSNDNYFISSSSWKDSFHLRIFDCSGTELHRRSPRGAETAVYRAGTLLVGQVEKSWFTLLSFSFHFPCTSAVILPTFTWAFWNKQTSNMSFNPAYWNWNQISDQAFVHAYNTVVPAFLQCLHVSLLVGTCSCVFPCLFFFLTLKAGSLLKLVHAAYLLMYSLRLLTGEMSSKFVQR